MKHINLIEWLQTDSHEKQSATRDHHGTKSRELPDNPRLYRYPCATLALPLRYVAMIFAVLTLSIANIGMAWGAEATISSASGNASAAYYLAPDGTAISAIAGAGAKAVSYNSGSKITVDGKSKPNATITFTIASGVTITSFQVNGTKQNNTTYDLDGTSVTFGTTLTGLSKTSSMTFRLHCTDAASSSSNRNTTITSIALTYTSAAPEPECGSTAQDALSLSSNSGTICGTGTATFTVSGGSGSGALSVSSSDETKATASIDGSTVTVTGVAAGSATITVTKACDATYAEKTATYSATVAAIPTANAGVDKTTEPGNGVALAATAAASGCTGAWTIQSGPNTSTAQLSSTSLATATFTPTVAGTYTLRWTVTNTSSSCSAYDEMTVSAAVCSISSCGNATLTYPIYTSGDLTTSNLFSGATSSNATAVSVGASPAFTGVTVSAATKGSSASAGACYAKSTPLTGKMKYSASSKSSSYYIDFPFTVNTGYTFTPCDVQVVIQPVSSNQTFTVEITNGTNVYGTSTATLNAGVMEPIIGLTSTAEMSAGNYAIRLYPHGGSNKEFRMGANVILKGTTAAVASDAYDIHIGKNNADYTDESLTNTSGTTWSKDITLDGGSYYEFKVKKTPSAGDAVYYSNNGRIFGTTSPAWDFSTGTDNCKLYTSVAGSYTFSWDASNNKLSVTYPAGEHPTKRIYMVCGGTWCEASPKFFVHSWLDSNTADTELTVDACDGDVYTADIPWFHDYVIFTRQAPASTGIVWEGSNFWNRSNGDFYLNNYNKLTFTSWTDGKGNFSGGTYSPTTYTVTAAASPAGYGTVSAASVTGVACGTSISTSSNTLSVGATNVTATPAAATAEYTYAFANWAWTPAGATVTSDVTATANFTRTPKSYTLTWNLAGGKVTVAGTGAAVNATGTPNSEVAFGTAITAPTVTKTGYTFAGWSSTPASTMPAANTTYTATWTAKTTTITINANTDHHGSTAPSPITATYGSALPSFTAATGASGYSLTGYFTTATSGIKVINADGTLVASTDYADGSGKWKYETATLTLFPQYEEEVSCTGDPTALVSGTLYQVSDMASACLGEITGTGQYFYGLSSNGKFYINGTTNANNASTGTVEMKTASNTIDKINFTGIAWFKGAGTTTCRSIKFVVPSAGTLTIYGKTSSGNGNVVIKTESSGNTTVIANSVNAYASGSTTVSAGTYYVLSDGGSAAIVGLKFVESACSTPAAPTGFTAGSITSTGATFSITDAANAASYDIYYTTSSTAPTAGTAATTTSTEKTKTVTGLTASTTYYAWVRSVCDADHKSAWVALSGSSFETSAAAATPILSWALATNSASWTATPTNNDETNLTDVATSTEHAAIQSGATSGKTCKISLSSSATPDKYVTFTFKVACGKKLTPSSVWMEVANVGGSSDGKMTHKAELSDIYGHTISATVVPASDGVLNELNITNGGGTYFQGEVTLKVWAWNSTSGGDGSAFRMGPNVKIFGAIGNQATPAATITWNTQPANGSVGDADFAYDVTCSDGSTVTVTSANTTYATIVGGKLHYAAAGTTHLVATATDACGNVVVQNSSNFTVSAAAPTYSVTHSLTNVTATSGATGAGAATEGVAYNAVFAANTGYVLPSTITVTIGGSPATVGTGYTWNASTGAFQVPAAQVTGAIVITIAGETAQATKDIYYGAITITAGALTKGSTGTSQFFTNIDAVIANNTEISWSSGPSTASQYYNSNNLTDTELSKSSNWGTSSTSNRYIQGFKFQSGSTYTLALGSKVASSITFYGRNGSESRTMTIGGEEWTSSATKNTHAKHEFTKSGGFTGNVSITQDGDFYGILVITIQTATPCTTPVIPALSNQTVCPGSDIAAWNATQTAVLADGETASYSWKKKGNDTEIEDEATLDLGAAIESMAGTYVVTVTVSKAGKASSSASKEVTLTVTPATEEPSITASKAKVYYEDEVVFTATCGSEGVTWQWYRCTNAGGTITGSCLSTTSSYTLASAPAAGTYYYKAVATGDGTHSCGTAEYVYTLVVSAANSCDKEFWFAKEGDRPTGAAAATHITGCPSGSSSASYTASIDGTNYTLTGSTGQKTGNVTIVVPADNTGTLYVVVQGSSSRTITLSKGGTQIGQETPANSTWGVFTFDNLDAGTYTLVSSGNISWAMMALKLCPTVACTDDTPTAAATNATVCAGGTITITATGYETGATFQWQKQNASTSEWEDIDDATSATYTVATAAAEHAGNYHIVATKNCARTSNTVTIAVPSAPVFNSFTTTRRIMETQALSISDVSATDAVSYTWCKSSDATWDAGDEEIGDSRSLLKPYDGETAGSTYYVICRAANSCGATTSSAITVTVQTLVEEDCAIVGNSGEHNTFAKTGSVSSGTYGSIAELHTNSNNKYIYYTAESGYYFATATVNACVGNASDLPTAAYSYSTDGGANWTDQNLTGMTAAYADHVINLPANVNAFRVGRRLGDCGISSNTIYIHQVCFTYNENCTKTTVDPSSSSVDYEIGDSFTEPTFTVKSSGVALSPQPTITYTSSDETVATVDDDGTVNFQDKAGTVVITAAYAGDATYCESEGSYTITVSCSDEAPKIIAADGTNIGGCNDNITLEAKKQDGTTNFSDGTYQWYRDGEAISGATDRTYTVSLTGVYSVERTSVGGCVSPSSNKATVTSESAEPEVERLTPFQYYHVDKVYAETSIMRFRHLFAVKNAGTTSEGKHFKMELSRNGGAATDVTNSNAFVMSADTVLLDLNKMYGKYEEDDELVLTCSAVDCEGNVSSIYKNTITIYVIDETPTLALICSGANGDGTRSTKNLVVGGDFLTGYNKADLCVQTGNTSFDKTQEWVLYTRLKENYIVTPVNGYAEFNKLNYEPFDILFLTDYPKASKSDAAATILDDMADLCDYRPLFTFKTHMVSKSPSKWAAKGFMAQPEVPKQSRLRLNIVCYAHPMFDDLKEVSDNIQKDAGDHSQIVYTMLTGPGHEGSKGMQGFPIDAAEGFVTIGLVHYDATAADDYPSDGYVTWTPGSSDVMLVAAAERQVNLEARMILFSINCGAQSKLTETGRQVVLKSLEYLLSDATIKPVADCSFTFTNGAGNNWTYEQYKAKCPACTGTIGDGKWSTAGNWGPDWILQPGKDTEVKIAAPVTVDMPHAKVRTVRILEGGSIDIPVGSGLEVKSTIRRQDGTEISPTEENDIRIGAGAVGNGTLIFNNTSGDTKAHVGMYGKGFIDGSGNKNYQYMGVPCVNINALYNYYGSWIYSWSDKGSGYGWKKVVNGGIVTTWTGYCITQERAGTYYDISGTLAATTTVDIPVPAGENMVVGNSWTAPIDINAFTDDDFENLTGNVYFFNTGVDKKGEGTVNSSPTGATRWAAGSYSSVPIHAASYTDTDDHIPSLQGFFVKNTSGSDGVLHLDYDRHVRGTTRDNILSGPMHAPKRAQTTDTDEPVVLKIKVSGENYDDKLVLLGREDFSEGFDNGWDGDKWDGNESALYLYTTDSEGTENSVSAVPELEGTVIGFRAGEDDEYTMYFDYLNGDEKLYLWDTETGDYTVIKTGYAYAFTTADKEKHARFIITRSNGQDVSTDITSTASQGEGAKAKKLLIGNKMYIMVDGRLFDATGKVVK